MGSSSKKDTGFYMERDEYERLKNEIGPPLFPVHSYIGHKKCHEYISSTETVDLNADEKTAEEIIYNIRFMAFMAGWSAATEGPEARKNNEVQ